MVQDDDNSQTTKEEGNVPHLHVSGGMQNEEEFLSDEHKIFHDYHYEQSYRQHAFEELAAKLINEGVTNEAPRHQRFLQQGTELLDKIYGTKWSHQCNIIRQSSPFGRIKGWKLASFIMKAGEDIRREALVMQIISRLDKCFEMHLNAWERPYLRPYTVMCVGGDSGLVECVPDCKNVDEVKKECVGFTSLRDYFERAYGPPKRTKYAHQNIAALTQQAPTEYPIGSLPTQTFNSHNAFETELSFEQAQDNFLRSLVGYSLVCYILQIKDRHNA
jgi:phosphatidylinositol 4-kinase